ncbi:MAG TPA: universal stress protein [Blastocatellia bacterium]|nr:universal stress protein [Blastocatellia bacterium]
MKILLAIDSSSLSEAIVREVEQRPWPPETTVCVLTVIDLLAMTSAVGYLEPFIKGENEAANQLVQKVAERLERRDLKATALAIEGYPGTTVVEQAESWGADFVFVGSHGHGGFVRFLLGSIAKAVVQNAPCSVEIVRRPAADDPATARAGSRRILLATDGSEFSMAAAQSIAQRPWPDGSEFRIVSVVEEVLAALGPWHVAGAIARRVRHDSRERCEQAVNTAGEILTGAGVSFDNVVLDGSPKKRIVEEAKEWGADILVVGSHGRRGLTRYLLGSVSEAVAMHAYCSVEVIRDRSLLGGVRR